MATAIHNVVAVNLQNINSATAAGDRTFTPTRDLRVFDLRTRAYTTNGTQHNPRVLNGANAIISITIPGAGSVANRIYRAGGEDGLGARLTTTCDDAEMLIDVSAGDTIVFQVQAAGSNYDLTAFCITA